MSASTVPAVPSATEIEVKRQAVFTDDDLGNIRSFEDAAKLFNDASVEIVSTDEFGDGFVVLPTNEKNRLCNVPFFIMNTKFSDGDNGLFVTLHVVTKAGEKLIVNDGSTGIRDQMIAIVRKGRSQGLYCPRGLSESKYTYDDPNTGEKKNATTYYLA